MDEVSRFSFPTDIRFGSGARSQIADFARAFSVSHPLLVTDEGLPRTEAYRLVHETMSRIWPDRFAVYDRTRPNPSDDDVGAAAAAFLEMQCDGVVGVGGGSALDVARATRLEVALPGLGLTEIPTDRLPDRLTPFCAVPTTAGTGSEVGRSSVITVRSLGRKVVVGAEQLRADMAILDPQLTVSLPPHLTAATGMDAMTHAIEAFVCPIFHPMCDAIALEAIRYVRLYLQRAVARGTDLEARGMMLVAAAMGAVAFQKDLGAAHSLSHPLSSEYGIHHGLANAIVLPSVVRFNGEENSAQYERVAGALGLATSDDPASDVAAFLEAFNRSVGIDKALSDLGVPRTDIGRLAKLAMEDGCHRTNPRKCTESHMRRLYEAAYERT